MKNANKAVITFGSDTLPGVSYDVKLDGKTIDISTFGDDYVLYEMGQIDLEITVEVKTDLTDMIVLGTVAELTIADEDFEFSATNMLCKSTPFSGSLNDVKKSTYSFVPSTGCAVTMPGAASS